MLLVFMIDRMYRVTPERTGKQMGEKKGHALLPGWNNKGFLHAFGYTLCFDRFSHNVYIL